MQFVIKLLVDHQDIGDVMVGVLGVKTHDMRCYPVEDDVNHVLSTMQLPPPAVPRALPETPARGPGRGTSTELVLKAVKSGRRQFKLIADDMQAAGFSRSGTGSLLTKMLQRKQVVQDADKLYWLPDEPHEAVVKLTRKPPKKGKAKFSPPGQNGLNFLLKLLDAGPMKPAEIESAMVANGWSAKSVGVNLSRAKVGGHTYKTEDGYWALARERGVVQPEVTLAQTPETVE